MYVSPRVTPGRLADLLFARILARLREWKDHPATLQHPPPPPSVLSAQSPLSTLYRIHIELCVLSAPDCNVACTRETRGFFLSILSELSSQDDREL